MAQFPAMPFWFDAYWRDTQHLTYEEHGIYLQIISLLWHAPAQRIPRDEKWLARRFKDHTPQAMALIAEFCEREGKWITKSKVRREMQYLAEKSEKQRNRVKCRWNKKKTPYHGSTVDIPPTPTPTPTKKERKKEGNGHVGGVSEARGKPRHGQQSKQGFVWLDRETVEWTAYAQAYAEKHAGMAPPTQWNGSGTWFNLQTGDA